MNTKITAYVLLALIIAFPFRYAFITQSSNNVITMVSFVATALGLLVFMLMTMTDGKQEKKTEVVKQDTNNREYKQAA